MATDEGQGPGPQRPAAVADALEPGAGPLQPRLMRAGALVLGLVVLVGAAFWFFTNTGGCPAALDTGTLVAVGDELALSEDGGLDARPIQWPWGFVTRRLNDGRLAVTDLLGNVKAAEGDHVQLPGGERFSDGPWGVCGDMDTLVE